MKVSHENDIYMVMKCNPHTEGRTMKSVKFFLVLSSGLSVLAGRETKSKYCVLFIQLIQGVCVCVCVCVCVLLLFVVVVWVVVFCVVFWF